MGRRPPPAEKFATEAAMCAAFIAEAERGCGWTAYPETQGWDILMVRRADGFQVGIQAKLRMNLDVLNQTIEDRWGVDRPGPDCRSVLVPEGGAPGLPEIASCLGITVMRMRPASQYQKRPWFYPQLPDGVNRDGDWHEQCPLQRHKLPEYVPDVVAGASAPVQLTAWKISAIKIAVTMDVRGFVTRADFKAHGIDHRRWVSQGWAVVTDGRYVRGGMPDFKLQHPVVYEQIVADAPKWMQPVASMPTQQAVLNQT